MSQNNSVYSPTRFIPKKGNSGRDLFAKPALQEKIILGEYTVTGCRR